DLGILAQMRVQYLDHRSASEERLLREVDVRHNAAPEPGNDAIATPRGAAKLRDLRVRLFEWRGDDIRKGHVAPRARRGRRAIPRSALRTKHASPASRQLPNCMRTKSNGGQGPLMSSARP